MYVRALQKNLLILRLQTLQNTWASPWELFAAAMEEVEEVRSLEVAEVAEVATVAVAPAGSA